MFLVSPARGASERDPGSSRPAEATDRQIGERVRHCREVLGLSQGDLARRLGLTHQQLAKYEGGHKRITAGRLGQIARALGVPAGDFYDPLPVTSAPGRGQRAASNRETLELVRAFHGIADPLVRGRFLETMRAVAATKARVPTAPLA